jgi:hypothetical protein
MSVNVKALGLLEDNIENSENSEICEKKWLGWYNNVQKTIQFLQNCAESDESKKLGILLNNLNDAPKRVLELKCDLDIYLKYRYKTENCDIEIKKIIPITIHMSAEERKTTKTTQNELQDLWNKVLIPLKKL